jgi:endoglucanase
MLTLDFLRFCYISKVLIMYIRKPVLLIILLIALFIKSSSQGFLHTRGLRIVNGEGDTFLLRGIGLGGWMLQEGYMLQTSDFANAQHEIREKIEELIGPANTDTFYNAWLANHIRKEDIDSMKAWGFNSVRLPMHYNLFTLPVQEEPVPGENTWLTKGYEMTDSLLSWCEQNEIYLILDLHAAPGGQGYEAAISDYNPEYPSLWESKANRDKTVALWKTLAERYADEPWIGGYDLINEPNWDLPGNTLLRQLYMEITDSIRKADTNHIIFIEGNWFANDFTNLSSPWDDNMVYSPHKYWNDNDVTSIQWIIDLRNNSNVPVWLGESGENSNAWFRDAILLLENNNIGWAWWPWKKISSISCPVSVEMTDGYQSLLNYWNGQGQQPPVDTAKKILMEMTEKLKLEHCIIHRDVIDAMFRQINTDATIAFKNNNIPGIIQATDFDLGPVGEAYSDEVVATYHSSTGTYTAWNSGWAYRNDGVDIEKCEDEVSSNGFNVGWISDNEWMQYEVNIADTVVYDVNVRVASQQSGGSFHLMLDGADICVSVSVPVTGGWQNWQELAIHNIVLDSGIHKLRFFTDKGGFNLNSMEFTYAGPTTDLETTFISGRTQDYNTIEISLNKPLRPPVPESVSDFIVYINGNPVTITGISLSRNNPRIIIITIDKIMDNKSEIKVSYTGSQILACDGTVLLSFTMKNVLNRLSNIHSIPGRIEAENFYYQSGISTETTTDIGGGLNIGYTDIGDYMDYYINVTNSGSYIVNYRVASLENNGQLKLQIIDSADLVTTLQTASFTATGGWQNWVTVSKPVILPEGFYALRLLITQPLFNLNWLEFDYPSSSEALNNMDSDIKLYPNPVKGVFNIEIDITQKQYAEIKIFNNQGMEIARKELKDYSGYYITSFDVKELLPGIYYLQISIDERKIIKKIIIE